MARLIAFLYIVWAQALAFAYIMSTYREHFNVSYGFRAASSSADRSVEMKTLLVLTCDFPILYI